MIVELQSLAQYLIMYAMVFSGADYDGAAAYRCGMWLCMVVFREG